MQKLLISKEQVIVMVESLPLFNFLKSVFEVFQLFSFLMFTEREVLDLSFTDFFLKWSSGRRPFALREIVEMPRVIASGVTDGGGGREQRHHAVVGCYH